MLLKSTTQFLKRSFLGTTDENDLKKFEKVSNIFFISSYKTAKLFTDLKSIKLPKNSTQDATSHNLCYQKKAGNAKFQHIFMFRLLNFLKLV
jgi:hypothetical protein